MKRIVNLTGNIYHFKFIAMKGIWTKIFLTILVILIGFSMVWFLVFDKAAVVSDISFATNLSSTDFAHFRRYLFTKGYRLKLVDIDNLTLEDSELLQIKIKEYSKYDLLILSPVATAFCNIYDVNVADSLEGTLTIGVSTTDKGYFDLTLDPSQAEVPQDVTDYRYRRKTSENTSVLIPDFATSLAAFDKLEKSSFNHEKGKLYYEIIQAR